LSLDVFPRLSIIERVPELLNRSVLREQLRERILQRILDGDYAPGAYT